MNKNILAAAIAATFAIGAVHMEGVKADNNPKKQKLPDLNCEADQIAEFDGELWNCIDTPSGGGGAPEYEFVDGDGNILGDVVFIEDGSIAWGYISDLSTTSTIQVTATFNKSGRSRTYLKGNVKPVEVLYESADCSGTGYLGDYTLALDYTIPGFNGEPIPYPPFLAFLETEPVYYLPDTLTYIEPASTWTEVIVGSTTGVYDFQSYNRTTDVTNCQEYSRPSFPATQIDSYGIPIDAPVMPINVVKK